MSRAWPVLLAAVACSDAPGNGSSILDAGFIRFEAGASDLGDPDAGAVDSGLQDGGLTDAGSDVGGMDQGPPVDQGLPDMGSDPCQAEGQPVSSAQMAASSPDLIGQLIQVPGVLERIGLTCQPETCPPDAPCCGTCSADLSIDGDLPIARSECFEIETGCTGNACGLVCLPPVLGQAETFVGRLQMEDSQAVLLLYRVQP